MTQRALIGIVALLVLATLSLTPEASAQRRMKRLKHIVIDPGHGGTNQGTPGAHGVFEKYVTLPLSLAIEKELKRRSNATVTLTRRTDTFLGLRERTRIANEAEADLFLSIHCNAGSRPEAHGIEVYFLSHDAASEEIAEMVNREEAGDVDRHDPVPAPKDGEREKLSVEQVIKDATMFRAHEQAEAVAESILDGLHRRTKAPRRGVMQAPFGVLKEAMMPAVVIEVGFLSHAEEGKKLLDPKYQKKIARGIVDALVKLDRALGKR
ncbi:MAG: N-acetylmuramoyl-L-alanine amidase [Myxococcota bacterium]|jgi:N-acetylmuramoyl-L-alanine amidase